MLKNDKWIKEQAAKGMISPFEPSLIRRVKDNPVISFGTGSYGYDIRLSPIEFLVFNHKFSDVVNPKAFVSESLEATPLLTDEFGSYFVLPAHSYGLGVALERLNIPDNTTVICIGKSSYARCGIIANLTPGEACLHPDTEVLSRTGWKNIADVLIGEEILCLNKESAQYLAVQDFHRYYFNGELLNFSSRYVSQTVTPQHKMWAAISKKRIFAESGYASGRQKGVLREGTLMFPFERIEAQEIFKKHNLYLSRDVNWSGVILDEETKIGDKILPTSAWLKFIGCWLGDGSAFVQERGNYVVKLAVVTKEKKRAYFKQVLTELGVNFWEGNRGFEFRSKAICLFLKAWSGAHNKRIPRQYIDLCPDQLKLIREGMMMSDGNIETSTYVSVSKGLVEDFQEISLKIGDNTSVWKRISSIKEGNEFVGYCCRFSNRKTTPCKVLPENCEKIPYAGFVYDLTVPSHVFLIRHNNKVSWTGNSWKGHLTLELSNSSACDCRIYADEGIAQLLFFEGEPCDVNYSDRDGKYQDQQHQVVLAKV